MPVSPEECARAVVEAVLLLMQSVYAEVKRQHAPDLSVSQFRALAFIERRTGASLSQVAEHLGISLPSASQMVDKLVARNLVTRQTSATDRRYVTLTLTAQGRSVLGMTLQSVETHLAEMLAMLPDADRATVLEAMQALQPAFAPGRQGKASMAQSG